MADEPTVALLQEIRDLQKQQVEYLRATIANQQQSLAHQQQSLTVQQAVVERQKLALKKSTTLWIFVLLGVFALFFLQLFPIFLRVFMQALSSAANR